MLLPLLATPLPSPSGAVLEPAADGCPGGWYRGAYLESVLRYARRRDGNGGRVANPFFDGAPWQIQEAVMYAEDEEERWHVYRSQVNEDRREAAERKRAAERTAQKGGRRRGSRR